MTTYRLRPTHHSIALLLAGLLLLCSTTAFASERKDLFTTQTASHIDEIFLSIKDPESLDSAYAKLNELRDYVIGHAGAHQFNAIVQVEGAAGIMSILSLANNSVENKAPSHVSELFLAHRSFMLELGLQINESDQPEHALRIAVELMNERPAQVKSYPNLAAAICVVHDRAADAPYTIRINENNPVASRPVEIFDFFVSNAHTMYIPPDRLPTSLLVFVVDVSESIKDLQWAHDTYANSPGIGQRFSEIVYDYEHLRTGREKKVTGTDYSIREIKKYGGICADQAYYAMTIAKASGIPSGYVVARGANAAHAWVGYLEMRGRKGEWNFNEGRYTDYQKLRGNITDPQTGEKISDGRLGILGKCSGTKNEQTLHTVAIAKAVKRMGSGHWEVNRDFDLSTKGNIRQPRTGTVKDRLALLKAALGKCAGVPLAWDQVTTMAHADELSKHQMDVWSKAVMQLSGKAYQDFSYDFLIELISTVDQPKRQHEMWEWAFGQFRSRPDLAAGIRFMQGKLWENNDNIEYAWIAYTDVIDQFLNEGPMVNEALISIGKILSRNDKRDAYLGVLQKASKRVIAPRRKTRSYRYTNYYRIHRRLVRELEYHNRFDEAKKIRKMIDMPDDE